MHSGSSIYFRVFVPFAIAIAIAMAAAWWMAVTQVRSALDARLIEQLEHATGVLADGTFPLTPQLLEQLSTLLDAEFFLMTADGQIELSTVDAGRSDLLSHPARYSTPGTYVENGFDLVVTILPPGRDNRYALITAMAPSTDTREAVNRSAAWLGGMALLSILLVSWWGHRVSSAVSRPVQKLVTMAQRIAQGDRAAKLEAPAIHELEALRKALNDLTVSLSRYEEQLLQKTRLESLGEMATRISHEIRNPLTAIKLHAQLMQESLRDSEAASTVDLLIAEIERLDLVVSSTLSAGRPAELRLAPCHLEELAGAVTTLMSPQLAHRNILLESNLAPLPEARLDGNRLKQVLFNLVVNAANVLEDGGRIRVSSSADDTNLMIRVEDSGPGLPPEVAAKLFEAPSEDRSDMRLGIGLLISREIVEQHGGTLTTADDSKLGGACFLVTIPRCGASSENA